MNRAKRKSGLELEAEFRLSAPQCSYIRPRGWRRAQEEKGNQRSDNVLNNGADLTPEYSFNIGKERPVKTEPPGPGKKERKRETKLLAFMFSAFHAFPMGL